MFAAAVAVAVAVALKNDARLLRLRFYGQPRYTVVWHIHIHMYIHSQICTYLLTSTQLVADNYCCWQLQVER